MASTNTITQTTESISRVDELFFARIMEAKTFGGNLGFQIVKARDKFALAEGAIDNLLQAYSCEPTATGDIDITDNQYSITKNSIKHDICYDIFKNTKWWEAISNMNDEGLPADFQASILEQAGKKIMAEIEGIIWNGNAGGTVDGFEQVITDKLTAASLTDQIVALTKDPTVSTTVQAALREVTAALPTALKGSNDVRIFVHPAVEQALWVSYANQAATNLPQTDSLMLDRYRIETIPNLDPNTIIAGIPENMAVALAVDSNEVELNVIDMRLTTGDNKARIVGNIGYGAGVATTQFVVATYTAPVG